MRGQTLHSLRSKTWKRVREQHGVIARFQLLALGWTRHEIDRRIASGRLHRLFRGVYAVGRPDVDRRGWWMAAVLAAGEGALLSHGHAAALYGIRTEPAGSIHVAVPLPSRRSRDGVVIHPRKLLQDEVTERERIPVVAPEVAIVDLAASLRHGPLETAVNEADIRRLITVPELRASLDGMPPRPGKRNLRETLDRRTFRFTRSELERAFIPLALKAGGPPRPETCVMVNGWEVDFYWPDLDFVVEADGLSYHRTPQQQARDAVRDHAHALAETERLRLTHSQIHYEPGYVVALLAKVARRLAKERGRQLQQVGHG